MDAMGLNEHHNRKALRMEEINISHIVLKAGFMIRYLSLTSTKGHKKTNHNSRPCFTRHVRRLVDAKTHDDGVLISTTRRLIVGMKKGKKGKKKKETRDQSCEMKGEDEDGLTARCALLTTVFYTSELHVPANFFHGPRS